MKIVTAPERITGGGGKMLFLSGSIEMGKAENWQIYLIGELKGLEVVILNPRRDDWDPSWAQKIDHPQFREQIMWELEALEKANIIAMYFDPNTMSPISLLELGLFARSKKLIVYCPEKFWRKGNVDIVCRYYEITQCVSMMDFICQIKEEIDH